ncbi:MAG: FHA domain-containing protein [Inconstantimicrobium porci]|uniref:FHA domain-containing protein n=1 Tax=Inconstantimicrobium porci TaxID=2652291 RepID=UPI002A9122D6|nr:FHA domain-containing protein [Inconstantimicrobium porci]MDY5912416.1 FHA domain-containing protein [Inconstantimicrobium porci]
MKFKAKIKNGKLFVKTRISSDKSINEREFNILEKELNRGFLKPKIKWGGIIKYSGPTAVSLDEYLKNPISKYNFFYIMEQILEAVAAIQDKNLFISNLIMDLRYVYINENTKEMQFIYIPVQSSNLHLDILEFMESISYIVKTSEGNNDFIAKYINFIKSLECFKLTTIENYIANEDKDIAIQISRHHRIKKFLTDKPGVCYEQQEPNYNDEQTMLLNKGINESLEEGYVDEATGLLSEEDIIGERQDDEATTLLVEDENVHYATLTRKKNNEVIDLNKPVFRIGKEKSYVDYFVSNNNAVSRSHADIITRENKYYVYDLNSTNHTYINNKVLDVKVETPIYDGDILRVADEEFIFHI